MKKILYISTGFPTLSQTFIDREVKVLIGAGYEIKTISRMKPIKENFSHEELAFYKDSIYLDKIGFLGLLLCQVFVVFSNFIVWCHLVRLIIVEKEVRNHRDRVRLFYHLLEAGHAYVRVKNGGFSHIHSHFLNGPTSIAFYLSRLLNIPFSFTMHGSILYRDRLMLKTKLISCKKAVTISKYNKKFLCGKYGEALAQKIKIIHCGIDLDRFKPLPINNIKKPIILSVGRLIEVKGFTYLLDACKILRDSGVDFSCLIVGDGQEKELLRNKSDALQLTGVVEFLGSQTQEQVLRLLQESTVFALPCIITDSGVSDGIPVALMEAMAMGLPVVSTNIVGFSELVESGKEGVLVQQRNPDELASAIEPFLHDKNAREKIGKQGREKIRRDFNIAQVPSQFNDIFS